MAVKPRFDGEWVHVSDAFDLRMGKTPSRKNPAFWSDGTHDWVSIGDLGTFGKYVGRTKEQINELAIEKSGIKPSPENTVLMSFKLSLGKASITTRPTYTNEAIMAFVDKGVYPVDSSFLYHQCRTKDWTAGTNTAVMGKTLNKKTLGQATVFLPEISMQKEIAARLDFVESLISDARGQLSDLDALVKSRFAEMFVGKEYPTSRFSALASSMRNGLSPSKSGSYHSKVLTLSAITQGRFDSSAWKDGVFSEEPPAEKRVSCEDFYVCRGNGNKHLVGAGEYPSFPLKDMVFPDTMIAVRIEQERIILPYLRCAWSQPATRKQIEASAKTTNGTFKINQTALGNIELLVPPLELQREFAAFAAQVDKSRFIVQQQIEKLQMLYDSLAQEYFS